MAADQILSPTTSSWEILFDWIRSSVTMASMIETAAENFVPLQFGFVLTVEAVFCTCRAY